MNSKPCPSLVHGGPALLLGFLMLAAPALLSGCDSLAYLDDPGADAGADGGDADGGRDGGRDAGPGACDEPNPAGCVNRGCPGAQVCDLGISRCVPTDCACDAATGSWVCTDDCGGGLCRPASPDGEITFVLSFDSDAPMADQIYIQASDSSGGPAWLELLEPATGEVLRTQPICSCACDACGPSCPVCEPAPHIVEKILPGEEVTYTWDATTHPLDTCANGRSCWGSDPLPHGRYLARFCYSSSASGEGVGHQIGPPICDEIPFEWLGSRTFVSDDVCWCG